MLDRVQPSADDINIIVDLSVKNRRELASKSIKIYIDSER
jgi:hypothetical protein